MELLVIKYMNAKPAADTQSFHTTLHLNRGHLIVHLYKGNSQENKVENVLVPTGL